MSNEPKPVSPLGGLALLAAVIATLFVVVFPRWQARFPTAAGGGGYVYLQLDRAPLFAPPPTNDPRIVFFGNPRPINPSTTRRGPSPAAVVVLDWQSLLFDLVNIVAFFGAAFLWPRRFLRQRTLRYRQSHNLCPTCGYDWRATPDRCPECGHRASVLNTRAIHPGTFHQ